MIIRAHRFHGYNALRSAYSRGQTVRGPLLAIKYLRNSRRSSYRAAVVVSRKVHKSAVVRGRIRRRIYEIIRGQEADIHEPYDIIITVFSDQLAAMPAPELHDMVVSQLQRCGVVTPPATDGGQSHQSPHAFLKSSGESSEESESQSHVIVDKKEPAA